jgi:hypothetical protein
VTSAICLVCSGPVVSRGGVNAKIKNSPIRSAMRCCSSTRGTVANRQRRVGSRPVAPLPSVIGYNLPLTVSHQSPTQLRPVTLSGLLVRLEPLEAGLGSTRFMDIAVAHRRLEIGATWLTPAAQRTGANIEAKLLLLTEAFERLRIQKVVFKTETLNEQSQRAIRALGAVEEGIFRQQFISESGRARDMIYFAIFAESWTETKTRLQERLERYRSSG